MMREQNVEYPSNGEHGTGFFVRPDGDQSVPGVVVIQEWWGLNEHMKDIARRFAAAGFAAIAPDLYHGVIVMEPNEAQKEAMALDRPRALKEISGAVEFLREQAYVSPKKIGVVGFCMGGGLALHATAHNANVGAVAAFYGGGAPAAEAFAGNQAAILNIIGEKDTWVATNIQKLDADFSQYSFPHEVALYDGAEHAFFNDTRPEVHDPKASADAWQRTLNWFHKYLPA